MQLTTEQKRQSGKQLKIAVKRTGCFYIEQAYAIIDMGTQGSTYTEKTLIDPMATLKPQSWYIAMTRSKDPREIALLSEITERMLFKFAGIDGNGKAISVGEGGAPKKRKKGLEDESFKSRRDLLPEAARLKRLSAHTMATMVEEDFLRSYDEEWFDDLSIGGGRTTRRAADDADEGGGKRTRAPTGNSDILDPTGVPGPATRSRKRRTRSPFSVARAYARSSSSSSGNARAHPPDCDHDAPSPAPKTVRVADMEVGPVEDGNLVQALDMEVVLDEEGLGTATATEVAPPGMGE